MMNVVAVASRPSLHQTHTLISFILMAAFLAFGTVPQMLVNMDRGRERRIAWIGTAGAAISIFLGCLPYWKYSIGASLAVVAFMTASAYMYTPYIKIRGKNYAFHVQDSLPDPSPDRTPAAGVDDPHYDPAPDAYSGTVTARKFWWLLIVSVVICVGCIIVPDPHKPWLMAPVAVAALVLIEFGMGYIDASWGYPIARGQRIQFAIVTIITAGTFAVLYLLGHTAGKRWPLRRKDSFEYRAHPRFWDNES
jgi:hypothetical protein